MNSKPMYTLTREALWDRRALHCLRRSSRRSEKIYLGALLLLPLVAQSQNSYTVHNLVSDLPGLAAQTDTNLLTPWGIAFSATGPFCLSDNRSGLSTIYNSSGPPSS